MLLRIEVFTIQIEKLEFTIHFTNRISNEMDHRIKT